MNSLDERFAHDLGEGRRRVDLLAPEIVCAGCIGAIERGLSKAPGIRAARVNLAKKRVTVEYASDALDVSGVVGALGRLGYKGKPISRREADAVGGDQTGRALLARLAVAGFAAANVMLLSVSVWTGAEDATRDLMHWLSAMIALPTVIYAGQPFYRSAFAALSAGRLNMDVPISLAVLLAAGVSLYETASGGAHAYFDAGVSLLFFLLIGRYLDHRTRGLARSAASELSALSATSATRLSPHGVPEEVAVEALEPGDRVLVSPGSRAPADGVVLEGRSDLDRSMITGEPTPETVGAGDSVHAGMLNLTGPLTVRVTATDEGTLLAEIARMIEAAERADTRFTRLADRAARIYAPGVHLVAALAAIGWFIATNGDWRQAILVASATLIITCPCALGLAVPAVQAAACDRLFRRGVLVKDGAALEKLALIDMVVFDKTGTVTTGNPELAAPVELDDASPLVLALASGSRHPLSRALGESLRSAGVAAASLDGVTEYPGDGVEGVLIDPAGGAQRVRLGRAEWVSEISGGADETGPGGDDGYSHVAFAAESTPLRSFRFRDQLRPDAAATVSALSHRGVETRLLSGDRNSAVAQTAAALGVTAFAAERRPSDKLADLSALRDDGRRCLMVGDGVNDAPALAAASVSMSPASGADVSRAAADLVFTGDSLSAVAEAHLLAKQARRRALENFGIAAVYNAIAIPLAVSGFATPMLAALAMSSSSILVTLNALRLGRLSKAPAQAARGDGAAPVRSVEAPA